MRIKNIANAGIVIFSITLAVGLFSYFGAEAMVRSLTGGPPPVPERAGGASVSVLSLSGELTGEFGSYGEHPVCGYWYEGLGGDWKWPDSYPITIPLGKKVYWLMDWTNTSDTRYTGYVQYYVYYPSGECKFSGEPEGSGGVGQTLSPGSPSGYLRFDDIFEDAWNTVGYYGVKVKLYAPKIAPDTCIATFSDTKVFKVVYDEATYELNATVEPDEASGVIQGLEGGNLFEDGTEVTITAIGLPGLQWKFDYWSGDVPSGQEYSRTITITMNSDKQVIAHFKLAPEKFTITVISEDPSKGTVGIWGIDQGGRYSEEYWEGEEIPINAYPKGDYEFDRWTGDVSSTKETVKFRIYHDMEATAHFYKPTPETVELTTSVIPAGAGSVDPSGTTTYEKGEKVTITAIPEDGWAFEKWTMSLGATMGGGNPIVVTMNWDMAVIACFKKIEPEQVTLTLKTSPSEGGSITLAQSSQVVVSKGTLVTLQAFPNEGWKFVRWSEDINFEENPITVKADEDMTIVANFEEEKGIAEDPSLLAVVFGSIGLVGSVASRFAFA